jgi:hypothetical protein
MKLNNRGTGQRGPRARPRNRLRTATSTMLRLASSRISPKNSKLRRQYYVMNQSKLIKLRQINRLPHLWHLKLLIKKWQLKSNNLILHACLVPSSMNSSWKISNKRKISFSKVALRPLEAKNWFLKSWKHQPACKIQRKLHVSFLRRWQTQATMFSKMQSGVHLPLSQVTFTNNSSNHKRNLVDQAIPMG